MNFSTSPVTNSTWPTDAKTLDMMRDENICIFTPTIIFVMMLMILGIPGNLLVLYIYWDFMKKNTARVFIMCLAIIDTCHCLIVHPTEIVIIWHPYNFDFPEICKVLRFSSYICSCSSSLVLVAIAVDRYYRICRPFSKQIKPKQAKILCVACLIIVLFFTWPSLVIYGQDNVQISTMDGPITPTPCLIDYKFKNTIFPKTFFIVLFVSNLSIVVILCILYSVICFNILRKRHKWQRSASGRGLSARPTSRIEYTEPFYSCEDRNKVEQRDYLNRNNEKSPDNHENQVTYKLSLKRQQVVSQNVSEDELSDLKISPKRRSRRFTLSAPRISADKKTTLMLFAITVVYVVSFLPFLALATHRASVKVRNINNHLEALYQLAIRSYLVNSAVNPFIYSFFNDSFRNECKKLFKRLFKCM